MTSKNNLTNFIIHNRQFEDLIRRVEDGVTFVKQTNSSKVLFFVNKAQQDVVRDTINHFSGVSYTLLSLIDNTDFKLLVINNTSSNINIEDYLVMYKIKYNVKFNTISHSDVLGSLMSLGIERKFIGDIVVIDGNIYFEVAKRLAKTVRDSLTKVKRCNVKLEEVFYRVEKVQEYQKHSIIIKSFRLDSVVSAITKLSRNEVKDYLLNSNVKLNQVVVTNFSCEIKNDDILSLKGYGRFILKIDLQRKTKKDNYYIEYFKFI